MGTDCRIHVLPQSLVKKIAAGEVVERPASVIKELLENALDAGATRIAVTIEDGGKKLIRVTDDGDGMSGEELHLAVAPHATSKLIQEDDLFSIRTMGFRGEALASISAVSKLRIVSRRPESVEGSEIRVVAEEVEACRAAGGPPGTTVEVRDLFFNVPARRKFLRATATETGQINEQIARVALSHPRIAVELTNNGRISQRLPVCRSHLERIAKFQSPELAAALLTVEREERGVRLEAYLAPPAQSRATPQWQYTFVNGRYIRDRQIQHAIKEAYRGLMEPNRHGVVFLYLTVDPNTVDVNVHPTKIEVRWADSRLIYSQVLSALRETLHQADLTTPLQTHRARPPIDPGEQDRVRREMAALLKATSPIQPPAHNQSGLPARDRTTPALGDTGPQDGLAAWRALYHPPRENHEASSSAGPMPSALDRGQAGPPAPRPRAIQMHNLYLVAETEDGIVIVDQHALHERVLYEQLRERITHGPLESQRLLIPETVPTDARRIALLEDHADLLARLGIEVSPFGDHTIAVHAFPSLFKNPAIADFLRDLLDRLEQQPASTSPDVVLNDLLSMMACKAAVKAGDPLAPEEIESLFRQRHLIDMATSCPHGRPTTLRFTKADLERQFHRT